MELLLVLVGITGLHALDYLALNALVSLVGITFSIWMIQT